MNDFSTFEDALAVGKEILGRIQAEEKERSQKRDQDEKEQLDAERQSLWDAMQKLLPGYFLTAFDCNDLGEASDRNMNRVTIRFESDGFAPIKCYFSRDDPSKTRSKWILQGFRVAEVEVTTDIYKHLGDPPEYGPTHVKYNFIQAKNFFTDTDQIPLALAISAENCELFTKISMQIDDLQTKEAAYMEEHKQKSENDENTKVLTLEEALLETLRQFIVRTIR